MTTKRKTLSAKAQKERQGTLAAIGAAHDAIARYWRTIAPFCEALRIARMVDDINIDHARAGKAEADYCRTAARMLDIHAPRHVESLAARLAECLGKPKMLDF